MTNSLMARGMTLLVVGLLVAGCPSKQVAEPNVDPGVANRGEFSVDSCNKNERVAVDSAAAYAIYVDKDGNPLDPGIAEDLLGTKEDKMCPTPPPPPAIDPSACPNGYCPRVIGGKTYCLRC